MARWLLFGGDVSFSEIVQTPIRIVTTFTRAQPEDNSNPEILDLATPT
jgi:hypothetical protein